MSCYHAVWFILIKYQYQYLPSQTFDVKVRLHQVLSITDAVKT